MHPTKSRDRNWLNWTVLLRTARRSGFLKLSTPPAKDRNLSVAIVGKHAGDVLAALILPMKHRLELKKVLRAIHNYPTLAEANRIRLGMTSHTCAAAPVDVVTRYHAWKRT
jgi:pyruvate/2-oxoglutarate dehydrogenase complex dihydrolipoamide dehydrogenase (E3) component